MLLWLKERRRFPSDGGLNLSPNPPRHSRMWRFRTERSLGLRVRLVCVLPPTLNSQSNISTLKVRSVTSACEKLRFTAGLDHNVVPANTWQPLTAPLLRYNQLHHTSPPTWSLPEGGYHSMCTVCFTPCSSWVWFNWVFFFQPEIIHNRQTRVFQEDYL